MHTAAARSPKGGRAAATSFASLIETYEDLGVVRTVDPVAAIIEVLYAPDFYENEGVGGAVVRAGANAIA